MARLRRTAVHLAPEADFGMMPANYIDRRPPQSAAYGQQGPLAPQGHAPRPHHPSALMRQVCHAAVACASNGTVTPDLMVSADNAVPQFLSGTEPIFTAMRELVAAARQEVLLQAFAWQDTCNGATMLRCGLLCLHQAQRERASGTGSSSPVSVSIFLRRSGLAALSKRNTAALDALVSTFDPALVQVRLYDHVERGLGLLHSKSLLVDGHTALICGANPEHHSDFGVSWYDSGCIFRRGGVVGALRSDLENLQRRCRLRFSNESASASASAPHPKSLAAVQAAAGMVHMLVVSRKPCNNVLNTAVNTPQSQAVLTALNGAQTTIRMVTPNLNAKPIVRALAAAAKRGVRVELLLPHHFDRFTNSRLTLQGGGNEHNVRKLARKVANSPRARACMRVRWFSHEGVAVYGNGPFTSHAKGLSVDEQLVCMSSFNYDTQSFFRSREIGVFIDSPIAAGLWYTHIFGPHFERGTHEIPRPVWCIPWWSLRRAK